MAVFTLPQTAEGEEGRVKGERKRGKMSGDSDQREENNHNHTTNHLRQYFFPSEPIPRLSISDPLASQLISEEVSPREVITGVCRCVGGRD